MLVHVSLRDMTGQRMEVRIAVVSIDGAGVGSRAQGLSWREWEHSAALLMRRFGFVDAAVTAAGTDGGVDIRSREAVGQVKARLTATSRPEIQQLHGVAQAEGKLGLFFSVGGYTTGAIDWAVRAGVALFVLESSGTARPIGALASELMARSAGHADDDLDDNFDEETFGAMVDSRRLESLLLHLAPGDKGVQQGKALAGLMASSRSKPLRVIEAASLGDGSSIPVDLLTRLVPGEVVYLDRIESFPDHTLRLLLAAFSGHLEFTSAAVAPLVFADLAAAGVAAARLRRLGAARAAGEVIPNVLVAIPPGEPTGELADLVATSLGLPRHTIDASRIERPGGIAAVVTNVQEGDLLFIDGVDHLDDECQEVLQSAVVDAVMDVVLGRGPHARVIPINLPRVVVVASTDHREALTPSLLSAFGEVIEVAPTNEEIELAVREVWSRAGLDFEPDAPSAISRRAARSRRRAAYMAHRVARSRSGQAECLSAQQAQALAEDLRVDDVGFTQADWLLQEWACGAITASSGETSPMPPVVLVAATTLPWTARRDVRDAFGALKTALAAVMVMPEVISTNQSMLAHELAGVPLLR